MSDFNTILSALLRGSTAIKSIAGNNVYPVSSPKTQDIKKYLPAILWSITSEEPFMHLGGATGLSIVGFQLDIMGSKHSEVLGLVDACRTLLNGYASLPQVARIKTVATDWLEDKDPYHAIMTFECKFSA